MRAELLDVRNLVDDPPTPESAKASLVHLKPLDGAAVVHQLDAPDPEHGVYKVLHDAELLRSAMAKGCRVTGSGTKAEGGSSARSACVP